MALTHRLFGIRSCNEVITGKRGRPCLEYDIKRCIAPCVDDDLCSQEEYGARGQADAAVPRRAERRARRDAAGADDRRGRRASGSRRRRSCATRCARCRRCSDRQQKMATAELGHRDVFGLKIGPAGASIQVFQVRGGRVVERVELGTDERRSSASSDGEVLEAAIQQFYELRGAPPEMHVPAEPDEREALEAWLSERAGRRVRIVVPQRGEKRGLVDLANRNAALAYQTRFNETTAAQYDALETLQRRARRCRRCRAASSASTSRRSRAARRWRRWSSAKTAGCGEASIGSSESRGSGVGTRGRRPGRRVRHRSRARVPSLRSRTTSRRCTKSCGGAIASCSSRAGRFRI